MYVGDYRKSYNDEFHKSKIKSYLLHKLAYLQAWIAHAHLIKSLENDRPRIGRQCIAKWPLSSSRKLAVYFSFWRAHVSSENNITCLFNEKILFILEARCLSLFLHKKEVKRSQISLLFSVSSIPIGFENFKSTNKSEGLHLTFKAIFHREWNSDVKILLFSWFF